VKSPYDAAWSSIERVESMLRSAKAFRKMLDGYITYAEQAVKELRTELREGERDL
jgi:hypothetical protein